jgi:hypothetical protein
MENVPTNAKTNATNCLAISLAKRIFLVDVNASVYVVKYVQSSAEIKTMNFMTLKHLKFCSGQKIS